MRDPNDSGHGRRDERQVKPEAEDYLWERVPVAGAPYTLPRVRQVIDDMVAQGMIEKPKQAHRTLEKWSGKGIYDYGVCLDLGWKYADAPASCRGARP